MGKTVGKAHKIKPKEKASKEPEVKKREGSHHKGQQKEEKEAIRPAGQEEANRKRIPR